MLFHAQLLLPGAQLDTHDRDDAARQVQHQVQGRCTCRMFSIAINPVYSWIWLSQLVAGMRRAIIDVRAHRYHARGVDGAVRCVVVALDVIKVHRGCDTG